MHFRAVAAELPARLFSPLMLLLVAVYCGWWGLTRGVPVWLVVSAGLLILAAGLVVRAIWAKYLLYALCAGTALLWTGMIVMLTLSGWPVRDPLSTLISLIPGLLLLLVCGGCVLATRRSYA
ncbi:MAG TPA: hypothetical protein VGC21_26070 [Telluria sp.]